MKVLTPIEARIVEALGQTLYPRGGAVPLDARQTRTVEYVDEWLSLLPGRDRILIRLMFVLFEVAMPVFSRQLTRFSRADAASQRRYLESWESSSLYERRMSLMALRSVFAMAYLSDPEVERQIGIEDGVETLQRHRREASAAAAPQEEAEIVAAPAAEADPAEVTELPFKKAGEG